MLNERGEDKDNRHHRRTTDELRDLVRSVRSGEFEYDEGPKRSLDWSSYTEAQAYELADMLYLIPKLVDEAVNLIPAEELERKGRGRPPVHSPGDVAKVLLMQSYFGVSNRVAAGLALVFKEKLRLSDTFSYKTVERGYDPGPVTRILQEVFRLTNEYGNANEDTFSFDGTGEPTSTKVNYESVRSEQRRKEDSSSTTAAPGSWPSRHGFQYSESSVGVHTKIFGGSTSTEGHSVGELLMFPSVLSRTRINCPGMEAALGDGLYSTRPACSMVTASGAVAEGVPHALDIGDGQLDGQKKVPIEAEEEAGVEEGRGVVPQEGCPQHPPVLVPVLLAARPHQEDEVLNYVPKPYLEE